jgi:hypothetical protein
MKTPFSLSAPAKLAGFAATLALLFGGGAIAGGAIDPGSDAPRAEEAGHGGATYGSDERPDTHGGATHGSDERPQHGGATHVGDTAAAKPVRGLAVAEHGLRLVVDDADLRPGRPETLRFAIVGDDGRVVRDFDVEHDKRMHLIVARRDLGAFQHVHPEQGRDGRWRIRLRVDEPGSYRIFADFVHAGKPATLAADLRVDGPADLRPLPAPAATARTGAGSAVRLQAGRVRPGEEAGLRFTVTRGGSTVHPEPYLGARGHLVALREGDLAFLHVHPTAHGGEADEHDDAVGFAATFPTAGRYRLFLQIKRDGRVETAAFTQEVR